MLEFVGQDDARGNEFRIKADVGNGGTGAVHEKPLTRLLRSATPIKAKDDGRLLCILGVIDKGCMMTTIATVEWIDSTTERRYTDSDRSHYLVAVGGWRRLAEVLVVLGGGSLLDSRWYGCGLELIVVWTSVRTLY